MQEKNLFSLLLHLIFIRKGVLNLHFVSCQQFFYAPSDAQQSEVLRMNILGAQPHEFAGIVGSTGSLGGRHMAAVEEIDGVNQKT